jgi:feruloyl-CoA synthase
VPGPEIRAAFTALTPDTVTKILFTSGSTGTPKAVLNTHQMLSANQQMMRQAWPFLAAERPAAAWGCASGWCEPGPIGPSAAAG